MTHSENFRHIWPLDTVLFEKITRVTSGNKAEFLLNFTNATRSFILIDAEKMYTDQGSIFSSPFYYVQ